MAACGELRADLLHVALKRPVRILAIGLQHVGMGLASDGDLLVLGHEHEIALSRHGIDRAGAEPGQGQAERGSDEADQKPMHGLILRQRRGEGMPEILQSVRRSAAGWRMRIRGWPPDV